MTQKTKLEIIDEYRKDHPGPFCTRDGQPIDLKIRDGRGMRPLAGYVGDGKSLILWQSDGRASPESELSFDLMCAREVPVAREFWLVEFNREIDRFCVTDTEQAARCILGNSDGALRIVRTLEALPGEGA